MAFAQKTVYALRAVYELTRRYAAEPIPISTIADAQAIPPRFLENILLQLKAADLVESIRGKQGGYRLARHPKELTVGDVLRAMEGRLAPMSCLGGTSQKSCPMRNNCTFMPMWKKASDAMLSVYDGTSYADLLKQEKAQERGKPSSRSKPAARR